MQIETTANELKAGDIVALADGERARITSVELARWIRHSDGPAYDIQFQNVRNGETGWHVAAKADVLKVERED